MSGSHTHYAEKNSYLKRSHTTWFHLNILKWQKYKGGEQISGYQVLGGGLKRGSKKPWVDGLSLNFDQVVVTQIYTWSNYTELYTSRPPHPSNTHTLHVKLEKSELALWIVPMSIFWFWSCTTPTFEGNWVEDVCTSLYFCTFLWIYSHIKTFFKFEENVKLVLI